MSVTETSRLLDFSDDTCLIADNNEVVHRKNRGAGAAASFADLPVVGYRSWSAGEIYADGEPTTTSSALFDGDRGAESPSRRVDDVICVFVVAFDTRAGNIIEWCHPEDVGLDDIEFKAMPSGAHHITYDFIYFKKRKLYGLSCFEKMFVDSDLERGARMKSVGVLASSYKQLHQYKVFLESQVNHLLKSPGNYESLREFYDLKKGVLPLLKGLPDNCDDRHRLTRPFFRNDLEITHPVGCFSQFVRFFGERVFLLWKFALLQKRILFFSPPPIGVVCYRVYCASCLSDHAVPNIRTNTLFYVNVADIEMLEVESNYIACTTEKIFQSKSHLYDVYVDNQNMIAESQFHKRLLTVTSADRENFLRLCSINGDGSYNSFGDQEAELDYFLFFSDLNGNIFRRLSDISCTKEKQVSKDDIRLMGLDPSGDRLFLMALVDLYDIDVVLPADNPCCPI